MASTRNRNMQGNYRDQVAQSMRRMDYQLFDRSIAHTGYGGNGLITGKIPNDKLGKNAVDIESYLFGIGSTQLENPQPEYIPQPIPLPPVDLFARQPIIKPANLIIEKEQRPLFY